MNDRAAPARKAARLVLRRALGISHPLEESDDAEIDDPTCAEHALVNILEEVRQGNGQAAARGSRTEQASRKLGVTARREAGLCAPVMATRITLI